jgi:hypothetical protein
VVSTSHAARVGVRPANRPLKGATPAASDIQEAKEILGEHYDNIEQKIEVDRPVAIPTTAITIR